MNNYSDSDNTARLMNAMMNQQGMHNQQQQINFMNSQKKQWTASTPTLGGQGSLLSMAANLFSQGNTNAAMFPGMFPGMNVPSPATNSNNRGARIEEITSQVLSELSDDLFDPPSDDIFDSADLEPVPLPPSSAPRQQNAVKSRFALLEDTLNQVLADEENFLFEENNTRTAVPPQAPLSMPPQVVEIPNNNNKRSFDDLNESSEEAAKRQRTEEEEAARRFRPYQAEQWSEKFQELLDFKKARGHCCVPHTFLENPSLARWVKRQRYQYKLKNEGKASTMTDERIVALENVGFVWDSHGAAWEERLNELSDYAKANGHCNVPSNFPSNPQLATWVKCQRRQYKLFWDSKPSNMNLERINKLETLGFEWELRGSSKTASTAKPLEQPVSFQASQFF